jgi:hypothetical protein
MAGPGKGRLEWAWHSGCMPRSASAGAAGRPSICPYPYPQLPPVTTLTDFLKARRRTMEVETQAVPDEVLTRPDLLAETQADLIEHYRLDEVALGKTTIDSVVDQERVQTSDPLLRGPSASRTITVDVHNAIIPIEGDERLIRYWPPQVTAAEPTERAWVDPRVPCIRIPARTEPRDPSNTTMKHFLQDRDTRIRTLVAATNAAVADWNRELPSLVRRILARQLAHLIQRTSTQASRGFPVATVKPQARPHRLPRPSRPTRAPIVLEHGDYPLLTDEDLAEVVAVIRKWADFFLPDHPTVVQDKDEPALRDELLHALNNHCRQPQRPSPSSARRTFASSLTRPYQLVSVTPSSRPSARSGVTPAQQAKL